MICIISDTHENVPVIKKAVSMIKLLRPELVIHCGDIISPPVLENFAGLPMRFVFGNNDGERAGLKSKCAALGFGVIDEQIEIEFHGKLITVYHGTNPRVLDSLIDSEAYDYVMTGHTHLPRDEKVGRTRVINPGACFAAERYTFAVLDPIKDFLEFKTID